MEQLRDNSGGSCNSYLAGFSALDRYYGLDEGLFSYRLTDCSLVELARCLDDAEYPGLEGIDALSTDPVTGGTSLYRCRDASDPLPAHPVFPLNLYYDIERDCYLDPVGAYGDIRQRRILLEPDPAGFIGDPEAGGGPSGWALILDAAVLLARYRFTLGAPDEERLFRLAGLSGEEPAPGDPAAQRGPPEPGALLQRAALVSLLEGPDPAAGLELLARSGFINAFWPELARLRSIDHAKEYHPEGDVWSHTLETFRYRKDRNLAVSLGLLLHDAGKPAAEEQEGNRFHRHAQLGTGAARRFLRRLGFSGELVEKALFFVRHHMLPAALPKLPPYRIGQVLTSPWFPELLEVYRCDLLSTFRGPEGYYAACRAYKAYLKNSRNPFRSSDGRKRLRVYVE